MKCHNQILPKSLRLKDIFAHYLFVIPQNQREYSWKADEQISRLWDDLLACIRHDLVEGKDHEPLGHYLGAIVLIKGDSEERHQVIDGQQRLTSLTILAACLVDRMRSDLRDSDKRDNWIRLLSNFKNEPGVDPEPRLQLNREDPFYSRSLLDKESQQDREDYWATFDYSPRSLKSRIVNSFRFFYSRLDEYIGSLAAEQEKEEAYKRLVTILCEHFYALVITVDDTRMAYRLFETLNERGLDLSQADLIRNTILEAATKDSQEAVDSCVSSWNDMLNNLEQQNNLKVPQLVQFSYSSRYNLVEAEKTFEVISRAVRRNDPTASRLAHELETDALVWGDFLQGDLDFWTDAVVDSQSAIKGPLWKMHCAPLILAVSEVWNTKKHIKDFQKALWLVECYLFRQGFIVGDSVSSLQKVFSESAQEVREAQSLDALESRLRSNSPDNAFRDAFAIASVSNMKQSFYVAWRIEDFLRKKNKKSGLDFRPAKQSPSQHLEHIMPRQPDSSWGQIKDHDDFHSYLNRLGNHLVLESTINQSVKNKSFESKTGDGEGLKYSDSELELPHDVIANKRSWTKAGEWTFESIRERQQYLAKNFAPEVWNFSR